MPVPALIEMESITKRFPGVLANDRVSFDVRPGEIHALLGENGAGKSTLMSILTGLYRPDEGHIRVRGEAVRFSGPREAIDAGIGMVHQHFRLVQPFTVAQNIILGHQGVRFFLDPDRTEEEIRELSRRYSLEVDPRAKIWQLSVGEQQRVEILKMLYRGVEVLILDEPTAVLTPQEAEDLFETLREMARQNKAVILITHKLNEVMQAADRITVLRGGKVMETVRREDTDRQALTRLMVGRDVMLTVEKNPVSARENTLELAGVHCLGDRGVPALSGISFTLRGGEILGVAGVAGNGQKELAEVIAGMRRVNQGEVRVNGKAMTNASPREMIRAGLSYIPEDRLGMGLVPNLDCMENAVLKDYGDKPVCNGVFIGRARVREKAEKLVRDFDVRTASLDKPVKFMSGGNLQRLLIAREVSGNPQFIVAVYPIRGLDVSAIEDVHEILLAEREKGTAILFISEDLDEIFKLSDRIAVIYRGRFTGVRPADQTSIGEVGMLMAGMEPAAEAGG